jgi:DNA-binding response OmpR family regulator
LRVLLVEDEDDCVGLAIADVLTHHGFRVQRARTVEQGQALLDAEVSVVVLDLGLPDRDGFELGTRVRRQCDGPIIIATARGELSDRVHGLRLGADDYPVKPFDIRELMARILAVTRRAGYPVGAGRSGASRWGFGAGRRRGPVQEQPRGPVRSGPRPGCPQ